MALYYVWFLFFLFYRQPRQLLLLVGWRKWPKCQVLIGLETNSGKNKIFRKFSFSLEYSEKHVSSPIFGWKHVQTISFFQFHFQLQFLTKTKQILINQFLFSSLWAIPQSPSNLSKPLPLDLALSARVMTTLSFSMTRPFSSRRRSLTPRFDHGFAGCESRPSRSEATVWGSDFLFI